MSSAPRDSISFVTLGCSKNEVDSEVMAGILARSGYSIRPAGELGEIVLINTCAFIDSAKEESIAEILEYARMKEEGRIKRLVVTGCLVQRYGAEVAREIPEIDLLLGTTNLDQVAAGLERKRGKDPLLLVEARGSYIGPLMLERVRLAPGVSAPLKIAEGCSKRCSFCAIPSFRGDLRSRPMEALIDEASRLAAGGVKELLIISQDTTSYGQDLYGRPRLSALLRSLAETSGIEWIRVHYNHPAHWDDELTRTFRETPQICRYVDMPVQHGSDAMLRAMNRGTSRDRLRALLGGIRETLPGATLRTTFLLGFPGETDEDFDDLLEFVEEIRFEKIGIFLFSPQDGTPAAGRDGAVAPDVAEGRLAVLRDLADEIALESNSARIGTDVRVLVEGRDHAGRLFGRTEGDAPEVDGLVILSGDAPVGSFITARVAGATPHDLTATISGGSPAAASVRFARP